VGRSIRRISDTYFEHELQERDHAIGGVVMGEVELGTAGKVG
jgi:hypothetical protein